MRGYATCGRIHRTWQHSDDHRRSRLDQPDRTAPDHADPRARTPATVTNTRGFEQDILIAWNETTSTIVTVYQASNYDHKRPALGVPELLKIANSLR